MFFLGIRLKNIAGAQTDDHFCMTLATSHPSVFNNLVFRERKEAKEREELWQKLENLESVDEKSLLSNSSTNAQRGAENSADKQRSSTKHESSSAPAVNSLTSGVGDSSSSKTVAQTGSTSPRVNKIKI